MSETFDATELMKDLDAGIFVSKLTEAVKQVALGTVTNGARGKTGKVTIELTMTRIAESNQIILSHRLGFKALTLKGDKGETNTTETMLHVNGKGEITIMPENQTGFEFEGKQ